MGQLYDKCKALVRENYEIVKDSMGKASGGDADGAFFVFDQPVTVDINLKEALICDFRKQERVLGVFFSDKRICPADCIVISRPDGVVFRAIPFYSEDLHIKIQIRLLELKDRDKLIGYRWNETDGIKFEEVFRTAKEDMTYMPRIKQWSEIKQKYPDAIILFHCGDFYKTYGDDAEKVARTCGITLSTWGYDPMRARVGFPHHALDKYLPKLVRAGYRLAICDPIEVPKLTKKLVKRGITETVNG